MSVKIRLALTGKSHQISYRLVAQATRSKRDGKFLEILGFYNPYQKENVKIDKEKIKHYLSKGATFTPSAKYLFENGKLHPKPKKVKESKTEKPQPQPDMATITPKQEEEPNQNPSETKENVSTQETKEEAQQKPKE